MKLNNSKIINLEWPLNTKGTPHWNAFWYFYLNDFSLFLSINFLLIQVCMLIFYMFVLKVRGGYVLHMGTVEGTLAVGDTVDLK